MQWHQLSKQEDRGYMNNIKALVAKYGINFMIDEIYKDPEKGARKIIDWADRFAKDDFRVQIRTVREVIENEDHPYHDYVLNLFRNLDKGVWRKLLVNFFLNANLASWPELEKNRKKYNCNIPWAILLDPTSACNLHCTGCWAAEYGNKLNLSFDEIDDIIRQGKELGVYMYIYTGGEPLVRKNDLIRICEKHDDCVFLCFTNGTLIDEAFADEMLRVGNFVPAISLEGFESATDSRRGTGVYSHVMDAMNVLREKRLPFGISACYTSQNYESISSEEFYDFMIREGALFVWFFHYMPVGNDASIKLLPTPEQRKGMYERIRRYRETKPLALPAESVICTSMPTGMWIRVYSSITPIPISEKRVSWKPCRVR